MMNTNRTHRYFLNNFTVIPYLYLNGHNIIALI